MSSNVFVKPLIWRSMTLIAALFASSAFIAGPSAQSASSQPASLAAPLKDSAASTPGEKAVYLEDFTVLPVQKNKLNFDTAILGEKDDDPSKPYIRERWHLSWRPGDLIEVYVIKPRGVVNPPVVLYLYSYPQDTDRFKQDYWCGVTTGDGLAAVGFVSAVTGQRLEYRSLKDDFFNRMPESIGATVHDVQMILNFLETQNEFDMSRVGMFGQGSGGAIAILASTVDPRIKALDVLTPWGDWPTFLSKSTMVPKDDRTIVNTPEFLKSVSGLDPMDWFPKVQARTVRIQNIRRDGHMPDEAQEKMESVAPAIAEIDQFGDGAAFVPAAENGKLLEWIRQQLKPSTALVASQGKTERVHYYPPQMPANPLGDLH